MTKWEYTVILVGANDTFKEPTTTLNKFGAERWELVHAEYPESISGRVWRFVMKRPKFTEF